MRSASRSSSLPANATSRWAAPCRDGATLAALLLALGACGGGARRLIHEQTIALPSGRFVGPVDLAMPDRAAHARRDFVYEAELHAACTPAMMVEFPDGERAPLGAADAHWQALLAARASAEPPAAVAPPAAADAEVATAPGVAPPVAPGRWVAQATETWPGQLDFLAQRQTRCAAPRTYRVGHDTAFDRDGRLTLWAAVPQELEGATLTVRVYEVLGTEQPEPRTEVAPPVAASVTATVAVASATPTSPAPAPRPERPGTPKATGATWVGGQWSWQPGEGKWVWIGGRWAPPTTRPAPLRGRPGTPPVAGCGWADGYWAWVETDGSWTWQDGHWTAPPPKVETPPPPQVPEQPWIAGAWLAVEGSFEWRPGHYGVPTPRAETPGPAPGAGARWIAGRWMSIGGRWTWTPGYYERGDRPPPAPRAETPGAAPGPGAVWLAGYWRWDVRDYAWVAGHWELPPGVDYVWVPDPPDPQLGRSIGGTWRLRIDVDVRVGGGR